MGNGKFCCHTRNSVDQESEVITHDANDVFNKLKNNLITKENTTDIISQGMPKTRSEFEDYSDKELRGRTRNPIAEISEKIKKKKKKKKKVQIKKPEVTPVDEEIIKTTQMNDENEEEEVDEGVERYQRTSKEDKFFLSLAIYNLEANNFDTFHAETYFSNSGDLDDKYELLGKHEEQVSEFEINFPEKYEINYNFEKAQYIKLVLYNDEGWKSEVVLNMALAITEQAPQFSVPIDFYKSQKLLVTRQMLKQATSEEQSYAIIKFERHVYSKKEAEVAFFLEFNYISMAFIGQKLHYKLYRLLQRQITGDKQELFCSNERYGKSPIYFNPSYVLKQFLLNNLPLYFEFYDKTGVIGEFLLDKKGFEHLSHNSLIIHLYDKKGITFGNFKISMMKMPNNNFLDYLNHGLNINFLIGIDYTSSNKDPMNPHSLHTLIGEGNNVYEKAILSCGGNLSYYDKSQSFAVFGFGGIPKGKNSLSHCFNINGNDIPIIKGGLENVIKVYKESLKTVKLLGPTRFSELIKTVLDHTIKFKQMQEEEEIMGQGGHGGKSSSHKNQSNVMQFRNLVSNQIKTAKRESQKAMNRSTTTPQKSFHGGERELPQYSSAKKPFNCPSLNHLPYVNKSASKKENDSRKNTYTNRSHNEEHDHGQRGSVVKKNIRKTIFHENEENPEEEEHFIIPKTERNYAILLILTDGKIDDMIETKNILVEASSYPISVIILGVGDTNFGNMIELRKFNL